MIDANLTESLGIANSRGGISVVLANLAVGDPENCRAAQGEGNRDDYTGAQNSFPETDLFVMPLFAHTGRWKKQKYWHRIGNEHKHAQRLDGGKEKDGSSR
jgi:hypothetical protein